MSNQGNKGEEGNRPREPEAEEKEFKKKMLVSNANITESSWKKNSKKKPLNPTICGTSKTAISGGWQA